MILEFRSGVLRAQTDDISFSKADWVKSRIYLFYIDSFPFTADKRSFLIFETSNSSSIASSISSKP